MVDQGEIFLGKTAERVLEDILLNPLRFFLSLTLCLKIWNIKCIRMEKVPELFT